MKNTCAGITTHKVPKLKMRIRSLYTAPFGEERLQLLVNKEDGDKVQKGIAYGAQK